MNTKFILSIFLILLIFNTSIAQVTVGKKASFKAKDLGRQNFDDLKKRTTVFVLDEFDEDAFETILKENWTLNPYIIITREEYNTNRATYITEKNAIWHLTAFGTPTTMHEGTSITYQTFNYWIGYEYFYPTEIKANKKGDSSYKTIRVASCMFTGSAAKLWEKNGNYEYKGLHEGLDNYALGYVKNYIKAINDLIAAEKSTFMFDELYNEEKIKELKTKTLYIPTYVEEGLKDKKDKEEKVKSFFNDYPYKYEIISSDELSKKILDNTEDFYYLNLNFPHYTKIISLTNSRTGDVIYRDTTTFSINLYFKEGDIKTLLKHIK